MALKLNGIKRYTDEQFYQILRKYHRNDFFYDFSNSIINTDVKNIIYTTCSTSSEEMDLLKHQWLNFEWIYDKSQFNTMLEELHKKRLPFSTLIRLLVPLENEWIQSYSLFIDPAQIKLPETFDCWEKVCGWFNLIQTVTMKAIQMQSISPVVIECITKSVHIIKAELDKPVFATNVSKRVNMSRSYFCQCFKKVLGVSFNQYLRDIRVLKAKEYLIKTDLSIQLIAEKTGYSDEKYFSKIFKKETGILPSKYRQTNQLKPGKNAHIL